MALEGWCFTPFVNQFAQEKDYPAGHAVRNGPESWQCECHDPGVARLSVRWASFGGAYVWTTVLTVGLDVGDIIRGMSDMGMVTPGYARPDAERRGFEQVTFATSSSVPQPYDSS